jgi:hypothetical protein
MAKKKPAEEDGPGNGNDNRDKDRCKVHDETWSELEQSQRVFEDFAELADLSCAHGSFFSGRGEIIIDAFL